jgi:hypothetical protein
MGQFQAAPNSIIPDRFFHFNGYLIAHATSAQLYNVYNDSTYLYVSSKTINLSVMQFNHIKSKGLIIFTSI